MGSSIKMVFWHGHFFFVGLSPLFFFLGWKGREGEKNESYRDYCEGAFSSCDLELTLSLLSCWDSPLGWSTFSGCRCPPGYWDWGPVNLLTACGRPWCCSVRQGLSRNHTRIGDGWAPAVLGRIFLGRVLGRVVPLRAVGIALGRVLGRVLADQQTLVADPDYVR